MNTLPIGQAVSPGGDKNAGAVAFGGPQQAAPAQFTVGEIGFGPAWSDGLYEQAREAGVCTACGMADSMAASIIRIEQENQELRAEIAVAEQERAIFVCELERLREMVADERARDAACAEKCRDKSQADGGWANI